MAATMRQSMWLTTNPTDGLHPDFLADLAAYRATRVAWLLSRGLKEGEHVKCYDSHTGREYDGLITVSPCGEMLIGGKSANEVVHLLTDERSLQ